MNLANSNELLSHINAEYDKIKKTLKDIISNDQPDEYHQTIKATGGVCEGWGLINRPAVAAGFYTAQAGTIIQEHIHKESAEYWIICEGTVKCSFDDESYEIANTGGSIYIPAGVAHNCEFMTYAEMIAVTIPACEGMPNAPF